MIQFNIYFGTIGKTLGCKYRFTKWCQNDLEAKKIAKNGAASMYYKYEGKHGLPSYDQISKESEITERSIEKLYQDHINDMTRYYVIPTEIDTIPDDELKY